MRNRHPIDYLLSAAIIVLGIGISIVFFTVVSGMTWWIGGECYDFWFGGR